MSTRFFRCPCCSTAHRVKEDNTIEGVLDRQSATLKLSEEQSYAWEKAPSEQGPDGRWRAQPSEPLAESEPDTRTWLEALAERARRFLEWYDAPQ